MVGWMVGESGNKANSASWSWSLAELGKNYFYLIASTYCLILWIKGIRGLGIIIVLFLKMADCHVCLIK